MHTIKKIGRTFSYITPVSRTDRPILGMVVGNNKKLMIDTGNSEDHAADTVKEILRLLDELEAFDADTYIPSHQRPWTKCGGDHQRIVSEYQVHANRELKEDELETIIYFVNGD
ncbi:hypothetical protein JNUCC24_19005 [Bacillus sp. JNUCC-24]|uniref:hypothetical protein n=1 Tax=Bacillus sp. JNUCC-24 TaxID=2842458 RepID=UPI00163C11C4|nr:MULTISPECIES: hypothetical protein [Bacillus]QNH47569.1 hypothetical protein H7F25_17235 [Bacillus sp. PAMC28571]QNK45428.1 hypothetical protein H7F24_04560 [Bacillus sp. PAMC22265]QWS50536.1 hypothetical protein JNUCC24_19005 [Bacillus sp. JNUCC-24]